MWKDGAFCLEIDLKTASFIVILLQNLRQSEDEKAFLFIFILNTWVL